MSNEEIFEYVYFYGFEDSELKDFLETSGEHVVDDYKDATLIIYSSGSNFKSSDLYVWGKKHKIKYMRRSEYLEQNEIEYVDDEYKYITESSESDDQTSREMCRLIKNNLPDFYDSIFVPFNYFKVGDWSVIDVLKENPDALFYNRRYLTDEERTEFKILFEKYVVFIGEIFQLDTQLGIYLEAWDTKTKITYLKNIMTDPEFKIISPLYLADLYKKIFSKYKDDTEIFDSKFKKALGKIITKYQNELSNFEFEFNNILNAFVCECPIDCNDPIYAKGFVNSVLLAIFDFADKLIDLNIYAIHEIITNIVDYYIPLDEINQTKKKIQII